MISLKRLNGTGFILNAELIEQIESTPDTVITLTTGNNIVVLERVEEVIEKVLEYRKKISEAVIPAKPALPAAAGGGGREPGSRKAGLKSGFPLSRE